MSPEETLVIRAAQAARMNPEAWRLFLEALSGFSDHVTKNCIQSPLEDLPRAQGRAQAVARVYELMASAVHRADVLEGKRK